MNSWLSKIIVGFAFFSSTCLHSQDHFNDKHSVTIIVPKVAMLDIESTTSNNLILTMTSPTEAGDRILNISDDKIWLNVTSVVGTGETRDISVKIDEPILGVDFNVASDAYSGSGFGSLGTPQNELTLTQLDQILVSGIRSGESGDGINNGFNLKYIAKSNNSKYGEITSTTGNEITVTYTLTR